MDRLVSGIHAHWGGPGLEGMCAEVARRSREDVLRVAALLEALYASFEDFPRFAALARVYFAIVSFAETSIRLGRDAASDPAFLLGDHPSVGPGLEALLREIRGADAATVQGRVEAFIRPIDVAGLLRRDRGNWHPVDAADLLDAADKLPATRAELLDLLRRCGFSPD
jgi:hypothetical protein